MSLNRRAFAGLACALLLALPAAATIVKSLSLEDLAREADVIVHGRIEKRTMAWNAEHTRIYTVSDVRVTESLKGGAQANEVIQVRQLGGTADGITQAIPGNAKLAEGEEVVLFLDKDEKLPLHYVVGMAQGKYTVDRAGAQPSVGRDLEGLAMAQVDNGRVRGLQHAPAPVAIKPTLDVFKAQIRAAIPVAAPAPASGN